MSGIGSFQFQFEEFNCQYETSEIYIFSFSTMMASNMWDMSVCLPEFLRIVMSKTCDEHKTGGKNKSFLLTSWDVEVVMKHNLVYPDW